MVAMLMALDAFPRAAASSAPTPKDSPAMKMLMCDSCKHVMGVLTKDVKYLIESRKKWHQDVLQERIKVSCMDPGLSQGAMKEACGYMIADYVEVIAKAITKRWTESDEEYEEDIVPIPFCIEVHLCEEGKKTIGEMISFSDKKEKDLEAEREEKKKAKPKKKPKAKTADADGDEGDENAEL